MPTVIPGIGSSVTGSDIITRACNGLGYLGVTEVLSAADANAGLKTLNMMLDSWAGEDLTNYAWQTLFFQMSANKSQYTIGTVGTPDINNQRPNKIYDAFITDTNNLNYPLGIVEQAKWNNIGDKNITSQIPNTLWYDSQFPLGVINIFPIPLLSYQVTLNVELQNAGFALLTTQLSVPPGYARAYILNLSLELIAQGFPCVLDQNQLARLTENASQAKANIKRANIKEVVSEYDAAIVSRSQATYNIFSDSYSRES
jgi:hypothetical protein